MNSESKQENKSFSLKDWLIEIGHNLCEKNDKYVIFLAEKGIHTNLFKMSRPESCTLREKKNATKLASEFHQEINDTIIQNSIIVKDFIVIHWHIDSFAFNEEDRHFSWEGFNFHGDIEKLNPTVHRSELIWKPFEFLCNRTES